MKIFSRKKEEGIYILFASSCSFPNYWGKAFPGVTTNGPHIKDKQLYPLKMQLFSGKSISLAVSETRLKSKLYSYKMQTMPSTFTRLWEIHYIFTQCTYTDTHVLIYMYIYFLSWYHTFKFYKGRAISNLYTTVTPASGTHSLHNRWTISSARFTSALCNSSKLRVTASVEGKETS